MDNNNLQNNVEVTSTEKPKNKKKALIAILISATAIILCLALILGLAFCNPGKDPQKPVNNSSDVIDDDDDFSDSDDDEDYDDDEDSDDDEDYDDEDYDDDEDYEEESDVFAEELKIFNSQAPIMDDYLGASSTIYHCSTYMPDKYGRHYTEEMATLELDRLQGWGIKFARTMFKSHWTWDPVKKAYNWENDHMQAFYRYAKELQDRDIEIVLTTGWHFDSVIPAKKENGVIVGYTYTGGINECNYIYGAEPGVDNLYGELDVPEGYFDGLDEDEIRIRKIGLRLGEWARQAVMECRKRGLNNIRYVLTFVEPCSPGAGGSTMDGRFAHELANCVTGYKYAFRKGGQTDDVLIMGPNQGGGHNGTLNEFMLKNYPDLYEVISGHNYPRAPKDTQTDAIAENANDTYSKFHNKMQKYDKLNRTYWNDEFQANSDNARNGQPSVWNGINSVVSLLVGMQYRVQNTSWWQLYDQLWVDSTATNNEFNGGIHVCGMHPSLFVSSIPKPQYYAAGLFTRYMNSDGATVYPVGTAGGDVMDLYSFVYMNALQENETGDWTIVVVNSDVTDVAVNIQLDKAINQTLYRHVYEAGEPRVSTAGHLADPDRVFKNVEDRLYDVVPAGSVSVYTARKY